MIVGCVTWETLSLSAGDAGFWLPPISDLIIVALAAAAAVPLSLLVLRIRARRTINGEPRRSRRRRPRPRPRLNRRHPAVLWLVAIAVIVEMEADDPGHQAWMQRHGWVFAAVMALRLAEAAAGLAWTRYVRRVAARGRAQRAGEPG